MRREIVSGLVVEPEIICDLGLAALDLRADMSEVQYNAVINKAAGGVDADRGDGDRFDYIDDDWWYKYWLKDQLEIDFD